MLFIKPNAVRFLDLLPEKDKRIVGDHISRLDGQWPPAGDLEKLYDCRYRMHISRRYTVFIEYDGKDVTVLQIMTIEQAHKRYGHI